MQTQTIFQAGNSSVVALPKDLMKELGFKKGQKVLLNKSSDGESIIISKAVKAIGKPKRSAVSEEFNKWLNRTLKEDAEILDELALR